MKHIKQNWIAIYTRPKWEKKVNQLIEQKGIRSYCPLIKKKQKWADRVKIVDFPLFSSYVFAQINSQEQERIRQTQGVVDIVYHCGSPATITDEEIERIKSIVENKQLHEIESVPYGQINIGDRIKVREGLLSDWQGEVITIKGKSVVMVLEQFNCALVAKVSVTPSNLLPVSLNG